MHPACSENHPRLGDTATIDEILQESFTQLVSRATGMKEYHSLMDDVLGKNNWFQKQIADDHRQLYQLHGAYWFFTTNIF